MSKEELATQLVRLCVTGAGAAGGITAGNLQEGKDEAITLINGVTVDNSAGAAPEAAAGAAPEAADHDGGGRRRRHKKSRKAKKSRKSKKSKKNQKKN